MVNLPRVVFEFWNLNLGAQLGISLNKGRQGFKRSEEKISTVGTGTFLLVKNSWKKFPTKYYYGTEFRRHSGT